MPQIEPAFVVKICGITNEADARAAFAAGANALGFNFYGKSPRYVSPSQARALNVPGNYLRVGVFVNASAADMLRIAEHALLDVLQLHGDGCEIPETSRHRIWRSVSGDGPVPAEDARIEAYLLDTVTPQFGGSGQSFDWSRAMDFPYRAIVAGGLDGSNVAQAIAELRPWGVDACSRIESQPGRKDAERMRAFVHAALAASESLRTQEIGSL
jgi:phosphoribosylanthranilate isomerase